MIKLEYDCEECEFHWDHLPQIDGKMPFLFCPRCEKEDKINILKKTNMVII